MAFSDADLRREYNGATSCETLVISFGGLNQGMGGVALHEFVGVCESAPASHQRRRAVAMRSDAGDAIRAFEEKHGAKVFEKLVEYPCEFTIKVIGKHEDSFAGDMVGYISKTVDVAPEKIKFTTTPSGKGTYTSVTIEAPVASADQLYECYAVLRNDPRVRMAL